MTTPASTLDHHAMGYWYDTDPADVDLVTPSLSFIDIPEGIGGTGVTTYRAVLFEVLTCNPVTFEITAGPTPPFGAPLGLVTSVPPSTTDAPAIGRVWISYTSTTAGASTTGSVTIRCVETNETWVINIAANTVARPKSAVVLVLDRSGSMSEDAGDGQPKIEKLREAVQIFVGAMLDGDGLGIVRFDHEINRLLDVTNVGPMPPIPGSGRAQAIDILMSHDPATTLDPRGATSIGGGVAEGKLTLDTAPPTVPPYSVQAMVVLTDGVENRPPMIADVASSINAHTFAIGLGTPANISTAALNALTQNNNGYLLVTGTITPDQTFRLTKYFLQILAGINNASVVLDPQGDLVYGAVHRIPFLVTEADMGIDIFLLSPAPYLIDFVLETPDGQTLDPGRAAAEPTAQFIVTPRASYYRLSLPALPATPSGSHAGRWHAVLTLGRRTQGINAEVLHELRQRALPYNLLVHAYSNLHFQATLQQTSYEPGAQVVLHATLREYDVLFDRRARVWAEVTRPDGVQSTVTLTPQSGGLYEGSFHTTLPGIYPLRVRAAGQTFYGRPFQREQTLTATVFPGGDRPGRDPGLATLIDWLAERDERFCHLIDCLLHDAGKVWLKRLAESGVDVERLVACLKEFCDRKPHGPQEATVAKVPARPPQLVTQTDLRRALANLESARAFAATFDFAELQHGEPIRREEPHDHHAVPMFDLSPEDKAAGEQPHHEPAPPAEPAQPEREQEAEPQPPFDLSPEDKGEALPKRRQRRR
jgi:hypothetical protein